MSDAVSESTNSSGPKKPLRFGLWHIFYFIALIASGIVVAGGYSLLISAGVLTLWWALLRRKLSLIEILVLCFIAMILVGMCLPAVRQVREASRRMQCMNNIRQTMLAMLNYESANQHFAPAWTVDDQGRPMHSWRVLILPFIDEQHLYKQYRMDEPWDSPHNSQLANQMPRAYHCPSLPFSTTHTTYKLVSDPEAFFHAERRPAFSDAIDGSSSTISIVEDSNNPVPWMKPDELSIEEAVAALTSHDGCHCTGVESLFQTVYHGQNVAALDGSTWRIAPTVNQESLRKSLRSADGHSPELDEFDGYLVVHKPQGYIALAMYLILLALPGWYLSRT